MNRSRRNESGGSRGAIILLTLLVVIFLVLVAVFAITLHDRKNTEAMPVENAVENEEQNELVAEKLPYEEEEQYKRTLVNINMSENKLDEYYELGAMLADKLQNKDFDYFLSMFPYEQVAYRGYEIYNEAYFKDYLESLSASMLSCDTVYTSHVEKRGDHVYIVLYGINEEATSSDGAYDYSTLEAYYFTVFKEDGTILPMLLNALYFDNLVNGIAPLPENKDAAAYIVDDEEVLFPEASFDESEGEGDFVGDIPY